MSTNGDNGHSGNEHGHATEVPDVSYIKNVDVTHELSDVNTNAILKFAIGLGILTIVTLGLMFALFKFLNSQAAKRDQQTAAGPMAMSEQEALPPAPRLQAARGFGVQLENGQAVNLELKPPQAEYRVLREQWERVLQTGKASETDTAALPINEAMNKVLESGLPARQQAGSDWKDFGINMPTAASSGRTTVKRTE
jgi:hypothetical protein